MSKLQELHDLLRDETKWPEGFVWDYSVTDQCALGLALASRLMPFVSPEAFGLDVMTWDRIFSTPLGNRYRYNEDWVKVTPSTVARRIKRHLKAQGVT